MQLTEYRTAIGLQFARSDQLYNARAFQVACKGATGSFVIAADAISLASAAMPF
jgi:hypothetical protein